MHTVASIDIGTITSRVGIATVEDGRIVNLERTSIITDLGEGVDATGEFSRDAIERVVKACESFVSLIEQAGVEATCTTLTSAARDAKNADVLLEKLRSLGLAPQVIPGEIEAKLTFFGVASDFVGERIAVVDSGGGSTEIVVGELACEVLGHTVSMPKLALEQSWSFNIGARRLTERYLLRHDIVSDKDRQDLRDSIYPEFKQYFSQFSSMPDRMIFVGGTITSLAAIDLEMVPYDSSRVHLLQMSKVSVERCIDKFIDKSVEQIAQLPGIQAKRAHVIQAGALIIDELLHAAQIPQLTISENGLITGVVLTITQVIDKKSTSIGWLPELS